VDKGVISKAGTWFSFGEERLGQGRENTRLFLREHTDIRAKIEAKLFPLMGLKPSGGVAPSTNGASHPDAVKAPAAAGVTPAKAVAVPAMADRRK
jgi:recombination protein RecA